MNPNYTPDALRLPPMAIESEQSLLGGLLIAGESAWDRIADIITESDFYRDDHRRIFRHIRRYVETGKTVDVVTISDAILQSNEADQTGGLAYLAEIANAVVSAANIAAYARSISETSRMRALLAVADHVQNLAFGGGVATAQERIDEASAKILALAEHGATQDDPQHVSELIGDVIRGIEDRYIRDGDISGIATGFTDLDLMIDGLKKKDLVILAGRPSMGKTALALNIAENVAQRGENVMVFSMEMGGSQLVTRNLSSLGRINSKSLASGRLTDTDWDRMTVALGKLHAMPIIIDQSSSLSAAQISARARRQQRKTGLSLVVIDYLQLMRGPGENRHQELSAITKALKKLAKDLDCPVICLSQLSRKVEDRTDKRPGLADLRESGAIEEDADLVLMLYRDEYYHKGSAFKGYAEVLVRKHRMGECGDVRLVFQPEYSRFSDADHAALADAFAEEAERKPAKARHHGYADA